LPILLPLSAIGGSHLGNVGLAAIDRQHHSEYYRQQVRFFDRLRAEHGFMGGYSVLGQSDEALAPETEHQSPPETTIHRRPNKQAMLIEMLEAPDGATISQIVEATGWHGYIAGSCNNFGARQTRRPDPSGVRTISDLIGRQTVGTAQQTMISI
jgi:hypothetical protein